MATKTCDNSTITKVAAGLAVKCRYTSVSNGDLLEIPVGVDSGTIVRRDYVLKSGSGSTLDYVTYNTDLATGNDVVVESWSTTAAAYLSDATRVPFATSNQTLWSAMTIDSGSDNEILVILYISTEFI